MAADTRSLRRCGRTTSETSIAIPEPSNQASRYLPSSPCCAGNITGQKRARGFANELKKVAPGLNIVASLPGDWDRQKAANITNDILQRNPDLVAIFCANDGMALGAVEAARAAGKDKVIVVGVDGNSDAVKSINAGRLNASVAQLPYLVGKQAVENAKKVLAGEKVEEQTFVSTLVLTKAVLDAKTEPMLQFVK